MYIQFRSCVFLKSKSHQAKSVANKLLQSFYNTFTHVTGLSLYPQKIVEYQKISEVFGGYRTRPGGMKWVNVSKVVLNAAIQRDDFRTLRVTHFWKIYSQTTRQLFYRTPSGDQSICLAIYIFNTNWIISKFVQC